MAAYNKGQVSSDLTLESFVSYFNNYGAWLFKSSFLPGEQSGGGSRSAAASAAADDDEESDKSKSEVNDDEDDEDDEVCRTVMTTKIKLCVYFVSV